jgi:hypothetical protein
MTVNIPKDLLIWAIPILLLGFIIGTGLLKRVKPWFWFFIVGWIVGAVSLALVELSFPLETGYVLARVTLDKWIGNLLGKSPTPDGIVTISLSKPIVILVLIVIALVIISVIDWSPKKKQS